MIAKNSTEERPAEDSLVITRIFDAPRELVWKAWTDPERIKRWFGPRGFTTPVYKMDLRVGRKYHSAMRSPDGQDFWSTGVFREIAEPERLVMSDSFADEKGNKVPASYYGMSPDWSGESLITVTFEEIEGKTRMTLEGSGFSGMSATDRDNARQGWSQSFDKLGEYLAEG
jgi:uncharacterized protein YndB with AHSA1/START domain